MKRLGEALGLAGAVGPDEGADPRGIPAGDAGLCYSLVARLAAFGAAVRAWCDLTFAGS